MTFYTTTTYNLPQSIQPNTKTEVQLLITEVCELMGVAELLVYSKCRTEPVKLCRWFVWKILKSWGYGPTESGRIFNKDHTSVINALKKIDDDIAGSRKLQRIHQKLKHHIKK